MKTFFAVALSSLPRIALACPVCARDNGRFAPVLIGAMILAPYAVAAVAVSLLRRSASREEP